MALRKAPNSSMPRHLILTTLAFAALLAALPREPVLALQRPSAAAGPGPSDAPLTDEYRRAFLDRLFANQHADDAALAMFERIERRQSREHSSDTTLSEDKTFRVIPTGTGYWRVLIEDRGRPIPVADYREQMANVQRALEMTNDPANFDMRRARERFNARLKNRAGLISAMRDAFFFNWLGRETRDGRTLLKLRLEPNPNYKPASRETELFLHASATVWADEATAHVVRMEAELTSDFAVGGGLLGKVYRGSRMTLEQTEVAPGVWMPAVYQYDFSGRKFFFGFEIHERTEANRYERVGPPSEALALVRRELSASPTPHVQQ